MGSIFYTQCWFQFYDEKLYIITMNINTQKMDYYTMFKNFTEKYGEPDEINPEKAVWSSDTVTMILEKPLSVKYIDTQVYNNILEPGEKIPVSFTATVAVSGRYEVILYINGAEVKRREVNFTDEAVQP